MQNIEYITDLFNDSNNNLYLVDHYPFAVADNNKYSQIEYTHKKTLNSARIKASKKQENAILQFVMNLWLYSDTKVCIFNYTPNIGSFNIHRKVNKYYGFDKFCKIDNINNFYKTIKVVLYEYTSAYILFENFMSKEKIYMYLDGTTGHLYIENQQQKVAIEKIASNCHLFLCDLSERTKLK